MIENLIAINFFQVSLLCLLKTCIGLMLFLGWLKSKNNMPGRRGMALLSMSFFQVLGSFILFVFITLKPDNLLGWIFLNFALFFDLVFGFIFLFSGQTQVITLGLENDRNIKPKT